MGKTKTKVIDDSVTEEPKKEAPKKSKNSDAFIESLNEMLGDLPESKKTQKDSEKAVIASDAKQSSSDNKIATEQAPRNDVKETKKEAPKAKIKPRGKKYQESAALVDRNVYYPLSEAVDLTKKVSYSKYDGTFEIHISTNAKNIRGLVSLPYASGKKVKIIAFGKGAEESGADMVGDEAKLAEIAKGKIDFDVLITSPEWMPKMAALAKVLGPKGLMPNPKNGTISDNLKKAADEIQSGKLEYKTESNGKVMHLAIGKVSQPAEELSQNVKILLSTIGKSKIKKATLTPTLGPGVKLDLSTI